MPEHDFKLILASGSPQRKQLLSEAGHAFQIVVPGPNAECGVCSRESPGELVARLARQKAADVHQQLQNTVQLSSAESDLASSPGSESAGDNSGRLIVACDTLAECVGKTLGKPVDRDHARQMLHLLRDREHRVYSGLCLWPLDGTPATTRVARTTLRMDKLSDEQIEEYLDSGLWEGKSGAFGFQDRPGWLWIVEGSESNVIGLPMELLAEMLADFGNE